MPARKYKTNPAELLAEGQHDKMHKPDILAELKKVGYSSTRIRNENNGAGHITATPAR